MRRLKVRYDSLLFSSHIVICSLFRSHRHSASNSNCQIFHHKYRFFFSLYLVSLSFYIQPLQFQKYSEYWIRYSNENEIMPSPRTRLCSMEKRRKRISNKKKLIREIHNKFSMPFFPIFFSFPFFSRLGKLILLFDWHEIVCTRASVYLHANSYEYHGKRAWYDSNLIFIGVVQIFFSFIQLSNIEI